MRGWWWSHDCKIGWCGTPPTDPDLWGETWSSCPWGWLRHPLFLTACRLIRLAEIAPLATWPTAYNAALVEAMTGIAAARDDHHAAQLREQAADVRR